MLLSEVFNAPVAWKWVTKPTPYVGRASFTINETKYVVTFEQDYRMVGVPVDDVPTTQFLCTFKQTSVSKSKQFEITGTGNASVVFGTVLDIIKNFHAAQPQAAIRLTAKEVSRQRLYNRIFKRMYPTAKVTTSGDHMMYIIPPLTS